MDDFILQGAAYVVNGRNGFADTARGYRRHSRALGAAWAAFGRYGKEKIYSRYALPPWVAFEDIFQLGYFAMLRAIDGYKPFRRTLFPVWKRWFSEPDNERNNAVNIAPMP